MCLWMQPGLPLASIFPIYPKPIICSELSLNSLFLKNGWKRMAACRSCAASEASFDCFGFYMVGHSSFPTSKIWWVTEATFSCRLPVVIDGGRRLMWLLRLWQLAPAAATAACKDSETNKKWPQMACMGVFQLLSFGFLPTCFLPLSGLSHLSFSYFSCLILLPGTYWHQWTVGLRSDPIPKATDFAPF